jgi:DNA mismatch repair protein MutS
MVETTPMMAQYRSAKDKFPDAILFFRLGDFYEMFEKDAREASTLLDLTLTRRNGVPMCGIPYHAAAGYVAKLLAAGKKVAICEQSAQPGQGRGLMAREVIEVVTPGTALDESYLARNANNYLLSLGRAGNRVSLAYADLSTAEFAATSFPSDRKEEQLRKELHRLEPKEVIVEESFFAEDETVRRLLSEREGCLINRYPDWSFDQSSCRARLLAQLGVANLKGFGLKDDSPEIAAAGVLLQYLSDTAKKALAHISSLAVYTDESFVGLDEATQKSLELLQNLQDGSRRYTLLEVLDETKTSLGARMLRRRLLTPLMDIEAIERRLSAVEYLYRDQALLSRLREALSCVLDLERLSSRVAMERANAKDMLAISSTLGAVLDIAGLFSEKTAIESVLAPLRESRESLAELTGLIERAIAEEPSVLLTEGNLIRRGYDAELDRLHGLKDNARAILEKYLEEEKAATGIGSLKLRYNRIIGYYFEVTKSNLSHVPAHFIRRQSLVGGERYTTDRLADIEGEINDASEKIVDIEKDLFLRVRGMVKEEVTRLLSVCRSVAELDVHQSLAFAATVRGYTRPKIAKDTGLSLRDGRHPVVEAHIPGGAFVPNSVELGGGSAPFLILTGPNMAGKSTFLRQTALIALMAQIGSFVPAAEAHIGIVDNIFCRVGASDNLARGESTFLVEMNETAHILRSASNRSLVIMDEIGRGTSTRDGLSIAWAVCLHLVDRVGARTLFATHFHELTAIKDDRVANFSMDVQETGGDVVFLKRVRKGPSDNSYGLHVARLAGLPRETIAAAEKILEGLTSSGIAAAPETEPSAGRLSAALSAHVKPGAQNAELLLFPIEDIVLREIRSFPLDKTSPLQALNRISRWKEELGGKGET